MIEKAYEKENEQGGGGRRRGGRKRRRRRGSAVCYVGVDLSATRDLTAVVFCMPELDEAGEIAGVVVWPWFYLPGADIDELAREARLPYRAWAEEGWLTLHDGDVIDYDAIRADINRAGEGVAIHKILMDPYNASQFAVGLMNDGFNVEFKSQSAKIMGPMTVETERYVLEGRLRHPNHPILNAHVGNCSLRYDAAGHYWPVKTEAGKSTKGSFGRMRYRIDGAIGLILGVGGMLLDPDKPRRRRRPAEIPA